MKKSTHRGGGLIAGIASMMLLFACLAAPPAAAQQWSGLGANDNWSTGANWVGGVAPASSTTTAVTFTGATQPPFTSVVDMPWTINRIDIFGAYNISGQPLTFAGIAPRIQALADPVISAPIVLTGPTTFSSLGNLIVSGGISGTGPLLVGGLFTTISGVSTFTGGVTVAAGALALTGSMPGPVTVSSSFAILSGTGTVAGPVTVNAGGFFNVGPSTGSFSAGGVTLAGSTNFNIAGAAPGTQYTFLNVTGTVALGGALTLSGSFAPAPGDVFTVIVNDGTDAISGTFAGLPEGATVMFNGVPLRISYVGGTGNDVTLSSLAVAAAAVPTLSEWAVILLAAIVAAAGMRSRAPFRKRV